MSLFPAIDISATGVDAAQTWIDTSAGNIANAQDAVPTSQAAYREQTPVLTPAGDPTGNTAGAGVSVAGVELGPDGRVAYDPTNPLADNQGLVRYPSVDVGTQLVNIIQAQEDYQANAAAIQRATTAYQAALKIAE